MGITLAVSLLYFLQILSVWPSFLLLFFLLEKKKEYCKYSFQYIFLCIDKMGSFNALIFELTSKV